MGNAAKKARQQIFIDMKSIGSLKTDKQRRYIEKEASKLYRQMTMPSVPTMRAFPCQKLKGKFAYIPEEAVPTFNEEDGLYYLDGKLIVSRDWFQKEQSKIIDASFKNMREKENNIKQLKPEVLGYDGN